MLDTIRKYFKGDPVIWAVIFTLSILSLLAVYSSTSTLAYRYQGGNTLYYMLKHGTFLLIGIVIIFITHMVPYYYFSRLSQLCIVIAVPLLLLTLILGTSYNEAARWLTLPGLGLTFQTSDFGKLALIIYIARILAIRQNHIKGYKEAFLPIIIAVILVCMLILPANLSTSLLLFFTSVILMFIGRIHTKYILGFTGIVLVLLAFFVLITLSFNWEGRIQTWKNRIEAFVNRDSEANYQVEQSKIAIASGGVLGKGPGKSTQRNFLPHPYSDFIFAIIVEEYGFFGGLLIVFLYLYLLYRAAMLVKKSRRTFSAFLSIGLTLLLVMQAMVNMAVAVNIFPVTGQNLPLVSMGGSSMLFTCIAFGMILSVSKEVNKQYEEANEE